MNTRDCKSRKFNGIRYMNKEQRNCNQEIKSAENRTIEGYAIVFNSDSEDLGGFTERINPTALDGVLEKSDILCLLNHNEDKGVLARNRCGLGSLKLEKNERGLKYSFEAPNTALGDELLEGIKRGDISSSSFAFSVDSDSWEQRDGTYIRTINKFGLLFDVSPVYSPAYNDTSVQLSQRSLEKLNALKESKKKEDLKGYYEQLIKNIG